MGLGNVTIEVGREVLEGFGVGAYKDIAILETIRLSFLIEFHTEGHILDGNVGVAPPEKNLGIDEEGKQEVHQHTANHDKQTLPGGFGAEFPRLFGLLHLLGIKTLVNHTGYLTIATQRNPAYAVLCIAVFGFKLEKTKFPVEENVKLIDTNTEKLCEEEVATLMEQYQQGDGQHEL